MSYGTSPGLPYLQEIGFVEPMGYGATHTTAPLMQPIITNEIATVLPTIQRIVETFASSIAIVMRCSDCFSAPVMSAMVRCSDCFIAVVMSMMMSCSDCFSAVLKLASETSACGGVCVTIAASGDYGLYVSYIICGLFALRIRERATLA